MDQQLSATGRVEAFSDGVMAIAITLLILDVKPGAGDTLAGRLLAAWPTYAAYLFAFLMIGTNWLNHHGVMRKIRLFDHPMQWFNLLLLLSVSFFPFPTKILAEALQHDPGGYGEAARSAGFFLGLCSLAMAGTWYLFFGHLERNPHLLEPGFDAAYMRKERFRAVIGMSIFGLSMIVALFNGLWVLGLFLLIILFYALTALSSKK